MMLWKHQHQLDSEWSICVECLGMAKTLTLQLCEIIEKYYSRLAVVFSGRMGFHVHVLDFDYRDWVRYRERDPIWCHHARATWSEIFTLNRETINSKENYLYAMIGLICFSVLLLVVVFLMLGTTIWN